MDARPAPISEAELEVLKALWTSGPSTVRAVSAALQRRDRSWAYTTVLTLLQRLEAKGYVRSDKARPAHVFTAVVSREQLLGRQLRDLADRLCDGAASPLLLALVEYRRLSAKDVRELRRLLDRLDTRGRP